MSFRVVLLSGPVASGKSTLAAALEQQFGARLFKTAQLLEQQLERTATEITRERLQQLGQRLDSRTEGKWVADALVLGMPDLADEPSIVVIDAIRLEGQRRAIQDAFGANRVVHVHLTATMSELAGRYAARTAADGRREFSTYEAVRRNRTESRVESLAADADIVIDTAQCTHEGVVVRVAARLGLQGSQFTRNVDVLVGGQYGSEGKGHVAGYLAPEYDLLIRSGGPNAGHSAFLPRVGKQVQHHLPSGTGTSNARLLLTAAAVIDPERLRHEILQSRISTDRLFIDPNAIVITKRDKSAEQQLANAIGSTAQGVGAATARKIMKRGLGIQLAGNHRDLAPYTRSANDVIAQAFRSGDHIMVEGTQGTGLSLHHGPYPYVTSRDTTVSGVLAEAGIPPARVRRTVMVCRTYPIRVESPAGSTSGELELELDWANVAERANLDPDALQESERTTTTGRLRRVQEFDWSLLRLAAQLNGPSDIALTFLDYHHETNQKAHRFEQLHASTLEFIEEVEQVTSSRVSVASVGFNERAILDRRRW